MERGTRIPQNNLFARDIYRAFTAELGGMTTYVQGAVILAKHLPSLTRLFDEIARVEMSHYEQLGQLLLHLGVSPTVDTRLRQEPLHLNDNFATAASELAARLIKEKIKEENSAAAEYRRLAAQAPSEKIQNLLLGIAEEEDGHALALHSMLKRFETS